MRRTEVLIVLRIRAAGLFGFQRCRRGAQTAARATGIRVEFCDSDGARRDSERYWRRVPAFPFRMGHRGSGGIPSDRVAAVCFETGRPQTPTERSRAAMEHAAVGVGTPFHRD